MACDSNGQYLISALTTEHFVMQGAIGASVNEQQARASMFLYSVSGALIAIGFMAQSDHFLLFVAAVLPVLFLAGLLTTLRLVDIGMESLQSHVTIARIRGHYRALGQPAELIFDKAHGRWPEGKTDSGQIIGPMLGILTTAASMIACVNGLVGAVAMSMLLFHLAHTGLAVSIVAGTAFALGQVVAIYRYQNKRIAMVAKLATDTGVIVGDDGTSDHDDRNQT